MMTEMDYKTIAAPRRARKVKGVKGADERYAYTVGEIISEQAAEGWMYLRSDAFQIEEKSGFFSSAKSVTRTVMVFGKERRRQTARPANQPAAQPAPVTAPAPAVSPAPAVTANAAPTAPAPELGGARRD